MFLRTKTIEKATLMIFSGFGMVKTVCIFNAEVFFCFLNK